MEQSTTPFLQDPNRTFVSIYKQRIHLFKTISKTYWCSTFCSWCFNGFSCLSASPSEKVYIRHLRETVFFTIILKAWFHCVCVALELTDGSQSRDMAVMLCWSQRAALSPLTMVLSHTYHSQQLAQPYRQSLWIKTELQWRFFGVESRGEVWGRQQWHVYACVLQLTLTHKASPLWKAEL